MAYTNPTVAEFKAHFFRDFPYGTATNTVQDADITKAISEAAYNFNPGLFSSQANYTLGFLYLTAHYLVMDLRASAQGIQGNYPWMSVSKSVGSVSESTAIPERIMANPILAMLSKTYYGAKYLSLVLPNLVGNVGIVGGATQA